MSNSDPIISPLSRFNLIIHTPHAGTILPIYSHCHPMGRWVRACAISPLHNQLCDHYTDKLFCPESINIRHISFQYSRLFCDVERLIDDPLEEKGLGICYDVERYITKAPHSWYGAWSMTKEQAMDLYKVHHEQLYRAAGWGCLILDCHSFSERDNILCPNAHEYKDIDICLGFNDDKSKPSQERIDFIANFFKQHGYRIAYNTPFSNAIAVDKGVWQCLSLMIEVNKHCYMDEDTLKITTGYHKLHAELQELYALLPNN